MLRFLVDANVPEAEAAFGRYGRVRLRPGRTLRPADLRDVDVLVVRSVTRVDAALVDGTPVRFVGTATAGTDHVDAAALAARGIAFAAAPGSNAASVVDYVLAVLLALAADRGVALRGRTLGVIGVGAVGGRLVPRARALGLRVLACDPPCAAAGATGLVPLADVLRQADVVSLHTPLTTPEASPWPTADLIGPDTLAAMRPGAWLLNAARGGVVDGPALLDALRAGHVGACALDVWPGEPSPDPALVAAVDVATPHIAGYALDAKLAGTKQVEEAVRAWLAGLGERLPAPWDPRPAAPPAISAPPASRLGEAAWLDRLARRAYDVRADDARFRATLAAADDRAAAFAALRRDYPERREWSRFRVEGVVPPALEEPVRQGLGMRIAGGEERLGAVPGAR